MKIRICFISAVQSNKEIINNLLISVYYYFLIKIENIIFYYYKPIKNIFFSPTTLKCTEYSQIIYNVYI